MDTFEPEFMARLAISDNATVKKFKAWLNKNPTGPLRKRRLAKLKADAKYIVREDAGAQIRTFGGRTLELLNAIDWDNLFAKLIQFIKLLLSLFL